MFLKVAGTRVPATPQATMETCVVFFLLATLKWRILSLYVSTKITNAKENY